MEKEKDQTALVCGAGGFIGHHLVKRLKREGYWVRGVDWKYPKFTESEADEFLLMDLRDRKNCESALNLPEERKMDEVYQLAANMGGAGFVFTGDHDFEIMRDSETVNQNFVFLHDRYKKLFYSSSACIYPEDRQMEVDSPGLKEGFAYPANPDSEYGWEKLFSERLYTNMMKETGTPVRIARFHNVYGPEGSWNDGREKVPAAMCRKVAKAEEGDEIEVWGDGKQTRSFLYIDECLEGIRKLMESDVSVPVNIGSDERISINDLVKMVADIAGKDVRINNNLDVKALGVRGRNSDNTMIADKLDWKPDYPLRKGMEKTYSWIKEQVEKQQ